MTDPVRLGTGVRPALLILPLLIFMLVMFVYPLVYNVIISLEDFSLQAVALGHRRFVGMSNLRSVLSDPALLVALRNTALFVGASLAGQFALGLALALLFSRRFPLSGVMSTLLLLPWMLPSIASVTACLWLFDDPNGLVNHLLLSLGIVAIPTGWLTQPAWALATVAMVHIWVSAPFNMVLLQAGLSGIPAELYEAAKLDGARSRDQFLYISWPLLRPVAAVTLLLGFIQSIKQFDIIWIMTQGGPGNSTQTLSTLLYASAFQDMMYGRGAAVGDLMIAVSAIAILLYVRNFALEEKL